MLAEVGASEEVDEGAVVGEDDVVGGVDGFDEVVVAVVVASEWTSMGCGLDDDGPVVGIGRSGRGRVLVVVVAVVVCSSLSDG